MEKRFDVKRSLEETARLLAEDETFVQLFPESQTEIVESTERHKTTRTHYRALGREGVATFHFDFEDDGSVHFEKVCDGRVWRELCGSIKLQPRGEGTRVQLELEGRTRPLVPEFTIRGPMQEQIERMAAGLRRRLQKRAGGKRA